MTILLASVLLAQKPQDLSAPLEAPFKVTDRAIIVDAEVNGRKASFMFDTGFGGYVVISDRINIGKPTGTARLRDFVRELEVPTVDLKSLTIGQLTQTNLDGYAVQQPHGSMTQQYGTHCDGIMGLSAVHQYVTEINFEQGKFIFHPRNVDITKRTPDNVRTFLVKLLPFGYNSLELECEVNGKPVYLALDTGNAFYVTTHKEVLERIGAWNPKEKPKHMSQAWVASGPVDTFSIWIHDAKIFGVPVKSAIWDIIDLPKSDVEKDGTVGYQFLKNFNIIIDYERRYVWLENFTGKAADEPVGEPGIFPWRNEQGRIEIYRVTDNSPAEATGIKEGDILVAIDGKSLTMVYGREIQPMLEGKPGTKVRLTISRTGVIHHFEVERRVLANGKPPE